MKIEVAPEHRTLSQRILASGFDDVLFFPLATLNLAIYNSDLSPFTRMVGFVLVALAPFLYSVFMQHTYGQTLGKMFANVRVTSLDGNLPSWRQTLQRDGIFVVILAMVLFYELPRVRDFGSETGFSIPFEDPLRSFNTFYVWGIWRTIKGVSAFLDRRSRGIHDYLGQTIVIIPDKIPTSEMNFIKLRQSLLFLFSLLWIILGGEVLQAIRYPKPIEDISKFQIQINLPVSGSAIKLGESVPIDWIISPAPHGYFFADIYFATDPGFEHRFDGYGKSDKVHNLWGLMRREASYQWHLQVNESVLQEIPEYIYLQIEVRSSLSETDTIGSNVVTLKVE